MCRYEWHTLVGFAGSFLRLAQVAGQQETYTLDPTMFPLGLGIIDLIRLLVRYGRASETGIGIRDCYCNCSLNIAKLTKNVYCAAHGEDARHIYHAPVYEPDKAILS